MQDVDVLDEEQIKAAQISWVTEWIALVREGETDASGWCYSKRFGLATAVKDSKTAFVRRRMWFRCAAHL